MFTASRLRVLIGFTSVPMLTVLLSTTDATAVASATAGRLDPNFGTGGKVITDFPGNDAGSWGLAIQRDGKIIAVGSAGTPSDVSDFALARYLGS